MNTRALHYFKRWIQNVVDRDRWYHSTNAGISRGKQVRRLVSYAGLEMQLRGVDPHCFGGQGPRFGDGQFLSYYVKQISQKIDYERAKQIQMSSD